MIPVAPANLLQGQAGVWRMASELALRGYHPHFPGVDFGYDLMIDAGIRIQVKCAHISTRHPYPQGAYWFKLSKQPIVSGNNTIRKRGPQVFSEKCDFVIFWGIEQNRFWVVPPPLLDNHFLVCVGPEVWHRDLDLAELKSLYVAGKTQEEIADMFGVNQMTISRRLRDIHAYPQKTISQRVRECEGRWDFIESSLRVLREADSACTAGVTASPKEE